MGPFITAYIKVNGRTRESREKAAQWLASLREHMSEAGLGQISEIFDGDPPHRPRGCIAQAWSVAELLRAAVQDVLGIKPARREVRAPAPESKSSRKRAGGRSR
jgi:glycogen debranching enzyme